MTEESNETEERNKYQDLPIERIASTLKIKLQKSNQLLQEILRIFTEIRGE